MSILTRKTVFLGCMCVLGILPVAANDYAIDIDFKDALDSWSQEMEQQADISELPKSLVVGDVYRTSYARAELQVASPAADTLQATHAYISSRCDGELAFKDVTTIFALTDPGRHLTRYLSRRNIIDEFTESELYSTSCVHIVRCFYDDLFTEAAKENIIYDNETRMLCEEIVEDGYAMLSASVFSLADMKEINYGDDMLINAKKDDGPFDLLDDIEQIGNTLFTHNDPASEIHFYDIEAPSDYIANDPNVLTPSIPEIPNNDENDPLRRLPATSGVDPDFPRSVYYDETIREADTVYIPPNTPTGDFPTYVAPGTQDGSGENPLARSAIQQQDAPSATATLHNQLCISPETVPEEEDPDIGALAALQQEHTYAYNEKLDLTTRVALASASMMLPEFEERYGIDPVEVLEEGNIDPESLPPLVTEAGLDGDDLSAIEQGMRTCVEEFAEIPFEDIEVDPNTTKKLVRKSISQPTELTKCIMDLLCFEIADDSGRGLYRIRGCTIPSRKAYGVTDGQKVTSLEEVVDEFSNVCFSLEESGQLLEHNKTKDAQNNKLMRVNFADKFSFSLSVGFSGLPTNDDPAYEKRIARENNAYLTRTLLGIDENLGHVEQRNKYVSLYDSLGSTETVGINTAEQNEIVQQGIEFAQTPGNEITMKEERSQLHIHAATLDILDRFVDTNIDYRISINDITHSIMQQRQAEMRESQQQG